MDYCFKQNEAKWQKYWEKKETYKFVDELDKKKFYLLDMFPYPSGNGLHVGHIKGYLATDIYARYKKMKGFCVLHPIGWDAFGLPAEQFAIKHKKDPATFTQKNIDIFREQLKSLNFSFDYNLEVNTSDSSYYSTTQWIFSEMFKAKLAVLQETLVNWCPNLNTVLSNEEIIVVDEQKFSERENHPVIAKKQKQWVLKITNFSEPLLNDLEELEWDEKIKKIQRNWIGKKEKYQFTFSYCNKEYFLYLEKATDIKKLKGIYIHEFSSLFKDIGIEERENKASLKIFLKDSFADKEIEVFFLKNIDFREEELIPILNNQIEFSEQEENEFIKENLNSYFIQKTTYKLKNWVFSRQRYWGEPFPIVYDKNQEPHLDTSLPVLLPKIKNFDIFNNNSSTPLSTQTEWVNKSKDYKRDVNTMPNWAGSSWYFLAYLLKKPNNSYLSITSKEAKEKIKRWMPVDIYIGGQEHANLHLLYARFWYKFLNKIGLTEGKEPFKKLINQGIIVGEDGTKMSKSKENYVNTNSIVDKYGGDLLRLNIAFIGPTELSQKWDDSQIIPLQKWLSKIFVFMQNLKNYLLVNDDDQELIEIENTMILESEKSIEKFSFNVVVSALMIFFNKIQTLQKYSNKSLKSFLKILSFFAPAFAEELWSIVFEEKESIFFASWPKTNTNFLSKIKISIQINNKHKFLLESTKDKEESKIYNLVMQNAKFTSLIGDKKIIKKIFIKNKILNLMIQ